MAIHIWNRALVCCKKQHDRSGEARCYGNLGAAYRRLGKYEKVIEYHKKSLDIKRGIGDKSGESACYTNLGVTYNDLGQYQEAIRYHKKSLDIKRDIGDKSGESLSFILIFILLNP